VLFSLRLPLLCLLLLPVRLLPQLVPLLVPLVPLVPLVRLVFR
jgi:hypothetical protein